MVWRSAWCDQDAGIGLVAAGGRAVADHFIGAGLAGVLAKKDRSLVCAVAGGSVSVPALVDREGQVAGVAGGRWRVCCARSGLVSRNRGWRSLARL